MVQAGSRSMLENKQGNIRPEERPEAEAAYNKARAIYDKIIAESK